MRKPGRGEGPGDGSDPDPQGSHRDAQAHAELSQTRPAIAGSVAVLRAAAAAFATRVGAPESTVERVKLAVSEAATNVVVHAYRGVSEPGQIYLEAGVAPGELRVSVADTGPGLNPQQQSPGLGLGLGIIASLADNFELLQGGNGGLRVLMRFTLPPTPS